MRARLPGVSGRAGGSSRGGGCGLALAAAPEKYEGEQTWKGGGSDGTSVPPAPARCWSPTERPSLRGLNTQPIKKKISVVQLEQMMLAIVLARDNSRTNMPRLRNILNKKKRNRKFLKFYHPKILAESWQHRKTDLK